MARLNVYVFKCSRCGEPAVSLFKEKTPGAVESQDTIFPAIDLKNGECVRLVHGDMARATVFNADPADQAQALADAWPDAHLTIVDAAGHWTFDPGISTALSLASRRLREDMGAGVPDA